MSCLFSSYLCLEETTAKSQVSDKVKQFMSCTFVRETENKIAEISVFAHLKSRHVEEFAHMLDLLICNGMFYNDDRIVNISSLHKVVIEKELYLMEEDKSPACTDFLRIYH